LGEVSVGESGRGAGEPAVEQGQLERLVGGLVELDEVGGEAVEVRDGEEGGRVGGEDRFLLRQVGGADRQDRAGRRHLVAEALEVRLAERPFPGERLAAHLPGAVAAVLLHSLGHLGELTR
jgi:hypothetical protein